MPAFVASHGLCIWRSLPSPGPGTLTPHMDAQRGVPLVSPVTYLRLSLGR